VVPEVGGGFASKSRGGGLWRGCAQRPRRFATTPRHRAVRIVDEPFQGLDPVNAEMLKNVLVQQRERGAAVIMSTHDMGDAQRLCDRVLLINGGKRVLYGTVDAVRRAFSDGAVEVAGRNLPDDTAHLESVTHVSTFDGTSRYLLRDGASAQDLFRDLARTDAVVDRFALDAPDLNEIFIRAVEGDARAAQVG